MSVCHFFFYIFNLPQGRRFWNCWSRVFFFFFENKNPPTPPSSLQNGVPQNIPHFLRIHPRSPSSRHSRPLPKFELKNVLSFAGLCEKNVIKTFFFFFLNSQGVWLNCCRRNFFFLCVWESSVRFQKALTKNFQKRRKAFLWGRGVVKINGCQQKQQQLVRRRRRS